MCTKMFITAVFVTVKTWNQPKHSSIDDWLNKLYYICTMEYYSAIKCNELFMHVKTYMDFRGVMLTEKYQS